VPQLDPMLPLDTPKGEGFAFWRTDYSQEHDTLYSVIITATREIWDFPQPMVRGVKNISMGRTGESTPFKKPDQTLYEAARNVDITSLHEFIEERPKNYDAPIYRPTVDSAGLLLDGCCPEECRGA
jgi:hypothetical protein